MRVRLAVPEDLDGVLALQAANHRDVASGAADGFVTVRHTRADLEAMHALAPSVVAVDGEGEGEAVVGYALVMLPESRGLLPILAPMFARLDALGLGRYYVMGQVCVAASHRGRGVFDALYRGHAEHYGARFERVVTEIATRNVRSMRAHARVGFEVVEVYRDDVEAWAIVARASAGAAGAPAAGLGRAACPARHAVRRPGRDAGGVTCRFSGGIRRPRRHVRCSRARHVRPRSSLRDLA
ncbi:MAG TPA: GNAT family N-acetyltransferase, partial [Minicystis sp.]|nr:GNAT family N-acetyltransferase [Minicystis sp.]